MTIYSNGLSKKRPIAVTISIKISLTIRTPAISILNTMNLLYQTTTLLRSTNSSKALYYVIFVLSDRFIVQ